MFFYYILKGAASLWQKIFYPLKVYGKENIQNDGKKIIICNHLSKMDVMYVELIFKGKTNFLAKKEWFDSKPRAWLFKKLGGIPIDRDRADIDSLRKCINLLKDGGRLCVFPEGTRNKNDANIAKAHGGAAMMAVKTQTEIIPINIYDRSKPFRKNYIYVGKSFDLSEYYGKRFDKEASEKTTQILSDELLNVQKQLEELLAEKGVTRLPVKTKSKQDNSCENADDK